MICANLLKDHYAQVPWKYINDFFQKLKPKRSLSPSWTLTPSLLRSHVRLYPRIIVSKSHENTSKYMVTVTLFVKNFNQSLLPLRWPLTSHLLRSHVWLYPRIIGSKSHGNTSMYVDTVINFAKYHIHTTYTWYILHAHGSYILYVQNEWSHSLFLNTVQARLKKAWEDEG